jgi:hypothetical protein
VVDDVDGDADVEFAMAVGVVGDDGRGIFASEIGSDRDNGEGCVHAAGLIGTTWLVPVASPKDVWDEGVGREDGNVIDDASGDDGGDGGCGGDVGGTLAKFAAEDAAKDLRIRGS